MVRLQECKLLEFRRLVLCPISVAIIDLHTSNRLIISWRSIIVHIMFIFGLFHQRHLACHLLIFTINIFLSVPSVATYLEGGAGKVNESVAHADSWLSVPVWKSMKESEIDPELFI